MIEERVRCTHCGQFSPKDTIGDCPTCGADGDDPTTPGLWEKVIVDTDPGPEVSPVYLHPSGVAFFAYEEAAASFPPVPPPAWAAPHVP